jgi:hypothetical protein
MDYGVPTPTGGRQAPRGELSAPRIPRFPPRWCLAWQLCGNIRTSTTFAEKCSSPSSLQVWPTALAAESGFSPENPGTWGMTTTTGLDTAGLNIRDVTGPPPGERAGRVDGEESKVTSEPFARGKRDTLAKERVANKRPV